MARVKRAVQAKKSHKKVLERAKGYKGARSRRYRTANEQVMHAMSDAYRDRRARKGEFRKLWITRINAAARQNGQRQGKFDRKGRAAAELANQFDGSVELFDLRPDDVHPHAATRNLCDFFCRGEPRLPDQL